MSRPVCWVKGDVSARTLLLILLACPAAIAQPSKPFLPAGHGIDWSNAGAGPIPARPVLCAQLTATATVVQINAALAACQSGQTVYLEPGTYSISATVFVPSGVTLRGAGADRTILNATGSGEAAIRLGSGSIPFQPHVIRAGAIAGSTKIVLGAAQGVQVGEFLVVTERNDPSFVTSDGSGGNCRWCDGGWSKDGSYARGQIVEVMAVGGDRVTTSPALYSDYTHEPVAVPFRMAATQAGVEDLQVRANNSGCASNFAMSMCAYCWVKGVESNYTDGDHVTVSWGFHDEVRDSYFSNGFFHVPGQHEADVQLGLKTSESLVENNIIERTHVAVMLQWGAAGNVIAYNYTTGEFDSGALNVVIGGVDYHGAHPQFNLLEGNVMTAFYADSVWGSSSDTTAFRNWFVGTNRICDPPYGRATVNCAGGNGHYGFQAARAVQFSYLATRNNFLGNLVGSAQMQSLTMNRRPIPQIEQVEYPDKRRYEMAQLWSFGYGSASDDGTGSGCGGGVPPCHRERVAESQFLHGNYSNLKRTVVWARGVNPFLPPSLFLTGRPPWWGALPYPAVGPDVIGGRGPGGHSFGNPAQNCYVHVMGGADGGQGSPLEFNAGRCYSTGNNVTKAAGENLVMP